MKAFAIFAAVSILLSGCTSTPTPTPLPSKPIPTAVPIEPGEPWIVYEWYWSGNIKDLSLMRADGSDAHPIGNVTDGMENSNPEWSPDGSQLAYEERDSKDSISIWISDADGSHPTQIAACGTEKCRQLRFPSWSSDGSKLAIVEYDFVGNIRAGTRLEVLDIESGVLSTLSSTDQLHSYSDPAWSPDDSQIAFSIETYDDTEVDAVGGATSSVIAIMPSVAEEPIAPTVITSAELNAGSPDWNPTTGAIAFGSNDPFGFPLLDEPSNIYTVNADGSNLTQLTTTSINGRLKLGFPSWTSDGSLIVITELTAQQTAFFNSWAAILSSDGGQPKRIDVSAIHARLRPFSG
jgi:Tol biopolymer transport system component